MNSLYHACVKPRRIAAASRILYFSTFPAAFIQKSAGVVEKQMVRCGQAAGIVYGCFFCEYDI
jgi:hypothetical protein